MSQQKQSPLPRLSREVAMSNPYWRYIKDLYRRRDGQEVPYHFIQSSGSVVVVPRCEDGRLVMVRQYRYIQQRWGIEFPGGGQQPGKEAQQSAADELQEETGYTAAMFTPLGRSSPCVGLIDEYCDVFLAEELEQGETAHEAGEEIEVVYLQAQELEQAIREGHCWSGMTQAAWCLAKLHLDSIRT